MNVVTIADKSVDIEVSGMDKLWSFKSRIEIPRNSIDKVYLRPKELKPPRLRIAGLRIPNLIVAGTYRGSGRKEFWNTHRCRECIVFDLRDFDYTRVVIEVNGAHQLIDKLS